METRENRDQLASTVVKLGLASAANVAEALRACEEQGETTFAAELKRTAGVSEDALTLLSRMLSQESETEHVHDERYAELELVGQGGMGKVYTVRDRKLGRVVALKMAYHENSTATLLNEARVQIGLEHPGILPVYDIGQTSAGIPYYTMRLLPGSTTLRDAINKIGTGSLETRLPLLEPFLQVCDIVHYAHSRGVVHRNIKPSKIGLGSLGEVVLLGWGLATGMETSESEPDGTSTGPVGTPGYMAPEVLQSLGEVDARSDVYSLGVVLYEILTGQSPRTFSNTTDMFRPPVDPTPTPRETDPAIPANLSAVCARALSIDKSSRFQSVRALAEALRACRANELELNALLRQLDAMLRVSPDATRRVQLAHAESLLARAEGLQEGHVHTSVLRDRIEAWRKSSYRRQAAREGSLLAALGAIPTIYTAAALSFLPSGHDLRPTVITAAWGFILGTMAMITGLRGAKSF